MTYTGASGGKSVMKGKLFRKNNSYKSGNQWDCRDVAKRSSDCKNEAEENSRKEERVADKNQQKFLIKGCKSREKGIKAGKRWQG